MPRIGCMSKRVCYFICSYKKGKISPNKQRQSWENAASKSFFADDNEISAWAKGALEAARANGIITGRSGNKIIPGDNATRAEAIIILLNALEQR